MRDNISNTKRRRRAIGGAAIGIGSILAVLATAAGTTSAYSAYQTLDATPENNNVSFWNDAWNAISTVSDESPCTKVNQSGLDEFNAGTAYGIVALKAGTTQHIYYNVEAGDVLNAGEQDFTFAISHYVTCKPFPEVTTTSAAPDTTAAPTTAPVVTLAPTTTVTPTTVAQPTTTIDDALANLSPLPPEPEVVALPATGSSNLASSLVAGFLVLMGAVLVFSTRRDRTA